MTTAEWIKFLRQQAKAFKPVETSYGPGEPMIKGMLEETADHMERLQAALDDIIKFTTAGPGYCGEAGLTSKGLGHLAIERVNKIALDAGESGNG